jgi:hypothetical protein
MKQSKTYPERQEIHLALEELLFQAVTTHQVLAAELDQRGLAVKHSPKLKACLREIERKRKRRNG